MSKALLKIDMYVKVNNTAKFKYEFVAILIQIDLFLIAVKNSDPNLVIYSVFKIFFPTVKGIAFRDF